MSKLEEYQYWTKGIDPNEYSHVLVFCDHWDYSRYCEYVKKGENYKEVIKNQLTSFGNMTTLEEVFVLDKDLSFDMMDSSDIKKAREYAKEMHKGTLRKNNNKEYFTHPESVAQNVFKYKNSHNIEVLIMAAYLHDTLEDTNATYYELVEKFGPQVASLVLELTTDEDLKQVIGKTNYLKIKMKNMSSWALVIKLCDRLDNVSDLITTNTSFMLKYAKETIEILDYLMINRSLSNTHLKIIKYILVPIKQIVATHLEEFTDYEYFWYSPQFKKLSLS